MSNAITRNETVTLRSHRSVLKVVNVNGGTFFPGEFTDEQWKALVSHAQHDPDCRLTLHYAERSNAMIPTVDDPYTISELKALGVPKLNVIAENLNVTPSNQKDVTIQEILKAQLERRSAELGE